MNLKIYLCAIDDSLEQAWKTYCGEFELIEVVRENILNLEVDAVVSPANSFGYMDGGLDLIYSQHFGWHVQDQLQQQIREDHHGELLVGQASIVETQHSAIPYVIAAPTMRVPMILNHSVNPYLAARAVFLLWKHGRFTFGALSGEKISDAVTSIAIPGLGTGVGRVPPEVCALQVRNALRETIFNETGFPESWADAQMRHQQMYTDQYRDLQY